MEQSPQPTKMTHPPNFGPQPYYPTNQQFSSVTSPVSGYTSPSAAPNSSQSGVGPVSSPGINEYI